MQNVIGPPVREQDFVGRSQELAHAWSLLRDNHLLLSAPRRVGKTSRMHRLQQEAPSQGHAGAAYCSAAGLNDEAEFVARLCATVVCTPGFESVASAIADHRVAGLLGHERRRQFDHPLVVAPRLSHHHRLIRPSRHTAPGQSVTY